MTEVSVQIEYTNEGMSACATAIANALHTGRPDVIVSPRLVQGRRMPALGIDTIFVTLVGAAIAKALLYELVDKLEEILAKEAKRVQKEHGALVIHLTVKREKDTTGRAVEVDLSEWSARVKNAVFRTIRECIDLL